MNIVIWKRICLLFCLTTCFMTCFFLHIKLPNNQWNDNLPAFFDIQFTEKTGCVISTELHCLCFDHQNFHNPLFFFFNFKTWCCRKRCRKRTLVWNKLQISLKMKTIKKFPVFNNNWNLIKIANCQKSSYVTMWVGNVEKYVETWNINIF